jgi:hypothetical protein
MKVHSSTPMKETSCTNPAVGMESGPMKAVTPLGKESKARVVICPRKAS